MTPQAFPLRQLAALTLLAAATVSLITLPDVSGRGFDHVA